MSHHSQNLEDYPLFYEELNRQRERADGTKKDSADRVIGLSEREVAKLSDDLRTPLKDQADTNPMQ